MVEPFFLAMPRGCLRFVIVVFPDHTHLLIFILGKHEKTFSFYLNFMLDFIESAVRSIIKYVLKRVSFRSKDSTKELKLECAYFVGRTS